VATSPRAETLKPANRFNDLGHDKSTGTTYTPELLADFVAGQIVRAAAQRIPAAPLVRVLDPAVGDGALLLSLVRSLRGVGTRRIEVCGFDTNAGALTRAGERLAAELPEVAIDLRAESFLEYVADRTGGDPRQPSLLAPTDSNTEPGYDLIIANPPYVRTQVMGATRSQGLAKRFGLSGRVDLYHAFLLAIGAVLGADGVAGIIVSNRFMTTRGGAAVRRELRSRFQLRHIWDLGDTKLFGAAVLPAVLLVEPGAAQAESAVAFTSIYSTDAPSVHSAADPIAALDRPGVASTPDGRRFRVQHGQLDTSGDASAVWRIATAASTTWLGTVGRHAWARFGDVGKVRVGVKTCADRVFIHTDWDTGAPTDVPELLRPIITHHSARRFRALESDRRILYPHTGSGRTRRAVDLARYPASARYLEAHRADLEKRRYVLEAGRSWYEIWVPQDPEAWARPKLVFRDIARQPEFWIDLDGSVVNGDCYWLSQSGAPSRGQDLLWLAAAVGNSRFIESFYDHSFHNKLYAGRRRFITQYVEAFPLPDPDRPLGRRLIALARELYERAGTDSAAPLQEELDAIVWQAFGLSGPEEAAW
jgi:adenine-specific DNA-methyltransferase